jgi:hypothetical protein
MHFGQRNLPQDITYWAPDASGLTNDFGQAITGVGVLIKGRWEDKVQQVRTATGEEVTSLSEVYVDRDVAIGGYLKKGDFTGETLPQDAREIQNLLTTPDLRNLGTERRAYL